jgi:hypothetical protein
VRRLAELQAKLLDEARLADAGLADDLDELPLASCGPLPAPTQEVELLLAPDERSQRAGAEAPATARAHDPKERRRLGHAFERMGAAILGDEQAGCLTLNAGGDQHGPRLGQGLNTRGEIRRVAEHLARRVNHDRPGVDADASRELRHA